MGEKASEREWVATEMEALCFRGLSTDHVVNQTIGIPFLRLFYILYIYV